MEIQAILVALDIRGVPGLTARDEVITREVAQQHGTNEDNGEYRQSRFPASIFGDENPWTRWRSAISAARTLHVIKTLPWETPFRALRFSKQAEYDSEITVATDNVRTLFTPFCDWYPQAVEQVRAAKSGTFREEMYPDITKIERLFQVNVRYAPIASCDQLTGLVGEAAQRARQSIEMQVQRSLSTAMREQWRRINEPLLALAEALADPERRRLSGVIERVKAVADVAPGSAILDDPQLVEASERIKAVLNGVSAEAVNNDPHLRINTANAIMDVARQFGAAGVRRFGG